MNDLISRQAAIDTLNVDAELLRRVLDNTDLVGAEREKFEWGLGLIESHIYDMEELPSAQPELIEKTAYIRGFEQGRTQGMIDTKAEGVAQPTADMVEVVRCKDCKFYTFKPQQTSRTTSVRRCNRSAIVCTKPDDYCSFGEREDT